MLVTNGASEEVATVCTLEIFNAVDSLFVHSATIGTNRLCVQDSIRMLHIRIRKNLFYSGCLVRFCFSVSLRIDNVRDCK